MRFLFFMFVTLASTFPASANVADYCAAYARDNADQHEREKQKWQTRYDNALQTCNEQFSFQEPELTAKKPAPSEVKGLQKPAEKKTTAAPTPKLKVKPDSISEKPQTTKPKPIKQLKSGSREWVQYCKNKYVSFNDAKGTYLSKTGVERKCLVTAD